MTDEEWNRQSEAEKNAWVKREAEMFMHCATMVNAGLATRWAGLIYFHPLCHDAYGENI